MRYCKKCVMPDTRPGIVFDEQGVCMPCRSAEAKKAKDWDKRFEELKTLSDKYRRKDGYYDCIIAVSGGKDSHFQVYVMKELLGMNPLLVSVVDPFTKTKAGEHNLKNIQGSFNCDLIAFCMSPASTRKMVRIAFEEFGSPTWAVDLAIYATPLRIALDMNIPLVVYGENISYEYGGPAGKETYSAKDQIKNNAVKLIDWEFWFERGVTKQEINLLKYPAQDELKKLEPIYLGYFMPWDGYNNYQIAKQYGFRDLGHEWQREGFVENYDQIDTIGYLFHCWMKYPKYGHARVTDVCCYWIRTGRMKREEAVELVRRHEGKLDHRILDDFINFTGYTNREFWNILDKFYNRDIFEKIRGEWKLKYPIWVEPKPLTEAEIKR